MSEGHNHQPGWLDEWDESEKPSTDRFVGFATIGERYLRGRSGRQVRDLCKRFEIPYIPCRRGIGMATRKVRELLIEAMLIDGDPSLDGSTVLWGRTARAGSPKLDLVTYVHAPWRFTDAGRLCLGGVSAKDVCLLCDIYGIAYTPRGQHDGEFTMAELQALMAAVEDDRGQYDLPAMRSFLTPPDEEERRRADADRKARDRRSSTVAPDDADLGFVAPSRAEIPTSPAGRAKVIDRLILDFLDLHPENPSARPAFYQKYLTTPTRLAGVRQIRFSRLLDRHAPLCRQYSIYVELTGPRDRGAGSHLSDSARGFLRGAAAEMRREILAKSGGRSKEAVSEGLLLLYGIQLSPSGVRNHMLCGGNREEPQQHLPAADSRVRSGSNSAYRTRV